MYKTGTIFLLRIRRIQIKSEYVKYEVFLQETTELKGSGSKWITRFKAGAATEGISRIWID